MARGRSVIEVAIIGDVKNLQKSFSQVNTMTGGLAGTLAKGFIGFQAIDKTFDVIQGGLEKADAFNDAFDRLDGTIGQIDSKKIEDMAFDFTEIGLSADEVGTLAANFAALATAAGVSAPTIATITPDILKVAAAVAATTGKTLDEVIGDIGKAAGGNQKPVSEYGVVVDKALNPEARILDILEQLKTLFPDVQSATDDLAGSQETLGAKWDNFTIKVGGALEGPLKDLLDFFTDFIDRQLPLAVIGLDAIGRAMEDFGKSSLRAIDEVADAVGGLIDLLGDAAAAVGSFGGGRGFINEKDLKINQDAFNERNYQGRPGGAN